MNVILHYDSGFPTCLQHHHRLAALLQRDGEPNVIDGWRLIWTRGVGRFASAWDYLLQNPWSHLRDQRKLIRVSLSND